MELFYIDRLKTAVVSSDTLKFQWSNQKSHRRSSDERALMRKFLHQMGLDRCPPFYKDLFFISAVAAGVLFWIILSRSVTWHSIPVEEAFSRRFLSLVLLQSLVEELLFRGFLQGQWHETRWGRSCWHGLSAANGTTSLLFVLSHLLSHPPGWAMAVFFPSMIFGYFRDRHDSLYPSIFLHIFYNAGYFYLTGLP